MCYSSTPKCMLARLFRKGTLSLYARARLGADYCSRAACWLVEVNCVTWTRSVKVLTATPRASRFPPNLPFHPDSDPLENHALPSTSREQSPLTGPLFSIHPPEPLSRLRSALFIPSQEFFFLRSTRVASTPPMNMPAPIELFALKLYEQAHSLARSLHQARCSRTLGHLSQSVTCEMIVRLGQCDTK